MKFPEMVIQIFILFYIFLAVSAAPNSISEYDYSQPDIYESADYVESYVPDLNNIKDNIDYKYEMNIKDDKTYNYQKKVETKLAGVVKGEYSLMEPDGSFRIVKYIADDNGFRAQVMNNYVENKYDDKYDEFEEIYKDIGQVVAKAYE